MAAKPKKVGSKPDAMPHRVTGSYIEGSGRHSVRLQRLDATEERLRKAEQDGEAVVLGTYGQAVRRVGCPFDKLKATQRLDVNDAAVNLMMWQAGVEYRTLFHRAGYIGIAAMDVTRDVVDGKGAASSNADHIAFARKKIREANAAIGLRVGPILLQIVVHEQPVHALRHLVSEAKGRTAADAIILERLREALHRLCEVWKLRPHTRTSTRVWHADP